MLTWLLGFSDAPRADSLRKCLHRCCYFQLEPRAEVFPCVKRGTCLTSMRPQLMTGGVPWGKQNPRILCYGPNLIRSINAGNVSLTQMLALNPFPRQTELAKRSVSLEMLQRRSKSRETCSRRDYLRGVSSQVCRKHEEDPAREKLTHRGHVGKVQGGTDFSWEKDNLCLWQNGLDFPTILPTKELKSLPLRNF